MVRTDIKDPRFNFALPRLIAWLTGGNPERTERNWLEANVVGAFVMLLGYLGLRHWLSGSMTSVLGELVLVIPLILVTWFFWLLALSLGTAIIRLLRSTGMLTAVPDARAQSALVMTIATAFACALTRTSFWISVFAIAWIFAIGANLAAAVLLALMARSSDAK